MYDRINNWCGNCGTGNLIIPIDGMFRDIKSLQIRMNSGRFTSYFCIRKENELCRNINITKNVVRMNIMITRMVATSITIITSKG